VTTTVTDGSLTIELIRGQENPKISAVEVHTKSEARYADSTPAPTPQPSPKPTQRPTEAPTKRPSPAPSPKPSSSPTPKPSASPTPRPTARPTERPTRQPSAAPSEWSFDPVFINSGGPSFTDSSGINWKADRYFVNGNTNVVSNTISIAETNDDFMFRSERWGPLKYEIPVSSEAGEYSVTLFFADVYQGTQSVGDRVFDVAIEGVIPKVFENLDIVAEAGGGYTALNRTVTTTVTDGSLTIELIRGEENPKFSAVVVRTASESRYADSTGSPTPQPSSKPAPALEFPAAPSPTLEKPIRINAGGAAYRDSRGRAWEADKYFNAGALFENVVDISGTDDPALYQTERYGKNCHVSR